MAEFKIYEGNPQLTPDRQQVGTDTLSIVADGLRQVAKAQDKQDKARSAEEKRQTMIEYNLNKTNRNGTLDVLYRSLDSGTVKDNTVINDVDYSGMSWEDAEAQVNNGPALFNNPSAESDAGQWLAQRTEQDNAANKYTSIMRGTAVTKDRAITQVDTYLMTEAKATTFLNYPVQIAGVDDFFKTYPKGTFTDTEIKKFKRDWSRTTLKNDIINKLDEIQTDDNGLVNDPLTVVLESRQLLTDVNKFMPKGVFDKGEMKDFQNLINKTVQKGEQDIKIDTKQRIIKLANDLTTDTKTGNTTEVSPEQEAECRADTGCSEALNKNIANAYAVGQTKGINADPFNLKKQKDLNDEKRRLSNTANDKTKSNSVRLEANGKLVALNDNKNKRTEMLKTNPMGALKKYNPEVQRLGDQLGNKNITLQEYYNGVATIGYNTYGLKTISNPLNENDMHRLSKIDTADGKLKALKTIIGSGKDKLNARAQASVLKQLESVGFMEKGTFNVTMLNDERTTRDAMNAYITSANNLENNKKYDPESVANVNKAISTALGNHVGATIRQSNMSDSDQAGQNDVIDKLTNYYIAEGVEINLAAENAVNGVMNDTIQIIELDKDGFWSSADSVILEVGKSGNPSEEVLQNQTQQLFQDDGKEFLKRVDFKQTAEILQKLFPHPADEKIAVAEANKQLVEFLGDRDNITIKSDKDSDGLQFYDKNGNNIPLKGGNIMKWHMLPQFKGFSASEFNPLFRL